MRSIPLNMMTLYADLAQSVDEGARDYGSISTRTVKGRKFLYLTHKDGAARSQRYLGPADDPAVKDAADAARIAADRARARRNTVSLLKRARIPAPTLVQGRILEVLGNAGLFKRGMTLVGTVAFQTYPCIVGAFLSGASYATNDIDISVAEFVAGEREEDIAAILKRADPTFQPVWYARDKLPRVFRSKNFQVDVLTRFGRGRKSPVAIEALGCAAAALSFQEYLAEETMEVVALYGAGVLVRVPTPARFAIHKLIVAQQRDVTALAKRQKDLRQASDLIEILREADGASMQDELDAARARGRAWKSAINASLRELGRGGRQGQAPVAMLK